MAKETEIICVVDRSGSMNAVRDDAIGGFNQFIEEQQQGEGRVRLTLTLFSHVIETLYTSRPVSQVDDLDRESYRPNGMTALYDAVGRTIEGIEELVDSREGGPPDQFIVLIVTDGKDNSSRDYSPRELAKLIAERDERDDWVFQFWGANINAYQLAAELSIDRNNVTQFDVSSDSIGQVFGEMSRVTQDFRRKHTDDPRDDESN